MPFMSYVPINRAAEMVRAINNAKTAREHREAQLRCEGYKQRCREIGQSWPCVALDDMFEYSDRPTCCGEYIDWMPAAESTTTDEGTQE